VLSGVQGFYGGFINDRDKAKSAPAQHPMCIPGQGIARLLSGYRNRISVRISAMNHKGHSCFISF
jgi:hypothetical protein